jgi:CoA-transferase family III
MAVFQGGGADKPQLVLGSVLDYFTSALLAYGVAAALLQRERSGTGQYLSLSLLRSALTIQAGRFVWAASEGRDVARDSGTGGLTGIHPTKRGALYISVHSNHFFAALCELIGRPAAIVATTIEGLYLPQTDTRERRADFLEGGPQIKVHCLGCAIISSMRGSAPSARSSRRNRHISRAVRPRRPGRLPACSKSGGE